MPNDSTSQLNDTAGPAASANQRQLAGSLGIACEASASAENLVEKIEQALAQDTMLEQARWFVLSVLRHQMRGDWELPQQSSVTEDAQYELAQRFLESDESMQALRTVLKDANCRFTLLGFAKRRNPERQILSSATKAFKRACQLLEEGAYLQAKSSRQQLPVPVLATSSASAVNRRAARRGHSSTTDGKASGVVTATAAKKPAVPAETMSEEEYAELDKVLDGGDAVGDGQHWHYQTNEDRFSLLLGLLAGAGFFVLALWLLL